ncbi:uncharacterized protein MELLADRAFT_118380 [Melampsora larici-populina 98AG31]|uniref:phosphatidylinositol-3,4,5-trisphosphate 3-phosphatase n=1 Tax=Melampsora larici-populina (strain 98AG31 / pathotype 3-4-7) TaxID=747676 RepID=F4S8K8_MELLP|nr:uncharacterized protein MELLADRAFT_118380 [Melampsora larici-populina 98AG31]EGF99007.1 hypothetical protein MELLADRAFT_118380 [Melampsora larici-populina 98AG31]
MNFDSIRKIVSGKKSRLVDQELGTDLDLSYITDRIIIMGYPASGLESLYRNRRKDVRRWLEARHDKHYRIYNFCPRKENEYEASYFHNQVRRFPFPDHHAPPLSMIPLFVHNISHFLDSAADNIAVIHCKAGKGRSGTMTVCYLMTLASLPQPPRFKDLYIKSIQQLDEATTDKTQSSHSHMAEIVDRDLQASQEDYKVSGTVKPTLSSGTRTQPIHADYAKMSLVASVHSERTRLKEATSPADTSIQVEGAPLRDESVAEIVDDLRTPRRVETSDLPSVRIQDQTSDLILMTRMAEKILSLFQFHTSRRMADPNSVPYGISIPSQRRSIRYWGDVLLGKDPRPAPGPQHNTIAGPQKIEIRWIKVFVPETVRYAKVFTSKGKVAVQVGRFSLTLKALSLSTVVNLDHPSLYFHPSHAPDVSTARPLFEGKNDDQDWEDQDEMIKAFASFGQEKRPLRKPKSLTAENPSSVPETIDSERRSVELTRVPGSRASISTTYTTETSTSGSMIHIDDSQLEETLSNSFSDHDNENQEPIASQSRYLTPVRLYDVPAWPTAEETPVFKKIKGGKNIDASGGIKIDADREILLRIVLGSTGKNHASLLPDATLLGYLWFIPAFHEPGLGTFSSTSRFAKAEENDEQREVDSSSDLIITSFPKEEIDFLNANISNIEVAWRRVP